MGSLRNWLSQRSLGTPEDEMECGILDGILDQKETVVKTEEIGIKYGLVSVIANQYWFTGCDKNVPQV